MKRSVRKKAGFDLDKVAPIDVVTEAFIPALFGHATEDSFIKVPSVEFGPAAITRLGCLAARWSAVCRGWVQGRRGSRSGRAWCSGERLGLGLGSGWVIGRRGSRSGRAWCSGGEARARAGLGLGDRAERLGLGLGGAGAPLSRGRALSGETQQIS
eukprot:352840-Chlamydomonas_euryale.AAC.1